MTSEHNQRLFHKLIKMTGPWSEDHSMFKLIWQTWDELVYVYIPTSNPQTSSQQLFTK